jgi:DNA polymerase III sliding clamp (beta) subunit (PCNA family)
VIISTKSLLKIIEKTDVIGRKSTLPILECCKIESDGKLFQVTATDLNTWATASCECEGELLPVCVNMRTFASLIGGGSETVSMSVDKGRLFIECGGRAGISTVPSDEFPVWPRNLKLQGVSAPDLADGIDAVKWAVETKPNLGRPMVNVIHVLSSAKQLQVTATNGRKCAQFERLLISAAADFIFIPETATMFCASLREPDAQLLLSENHVEAKSPNYSLAIRLQDGNYFKTDSVTKAVHEPIGEIICAELVSALETIVLLQRDPAFAGGAQVETSQRGLKVSFADDANEFTTTLPGEFKSSRFGIHAPSSAEMFRKFPAARATLMLDNLEIPTGLKIQDGDYMSIISLMR